MATYDLVAGATELIWTQIQNQQVFVSESGVEQVRKRAGARWALEIRFENVTEDKRRALWGVVARLNGREHRLSVSLDQHGYVRGGVGSGSPTTQAALTAGASQCAITGAAPFVTYVRAGDYVQIANELKIITEDASTIAGGNATINFWPPMHQSYASGQSVDANSPAGVFILQNHSGFDTSAAIYRDWVSNLSLTLIEDVLA